MPKDLAACQQTYAQLKQELLGLGFICVGTVLKRYMPCGKPGCRCQADPPQLHGPYYQWTRKIHGKTVTVRLNKREAPLYEAYATNRKKLQAIIDRMEAVSMKALTLQLEEKS